MSHVFGCEEGKREAFKHVWMALHALSLMLFDRPQGCRLWQECEKAEYLLWMSHNYLREVFNSCIRVCHRDAMQTTVYRQDMLGNMGPSIDKGFNCAEFLYY